MTTVLETQILGVVLLFSRMGGCIILAPGLSSPRVPVHVRLFMAIGVTFALAPLMMQDVVERLISTPAHQHVLLILQETLFGLLIGFLARCFFLALQFAATAVSNFIGLAGIPGIPLEEGDTGSPLATLTSTAGILIVFTLGLHVELLRAVIDSYAVLPIGQAVTAELALSNVLSTITETWLLALRLAGPFLLYGVIVNFALALGNRFAQQISVYHATTGAVMLGGFLLLYLIWLDWIMVFAGAYSSWLMEGGFGG